MINLRIQAPEVKQNVLSPRISVIGVGGAGGNAVNNMIATGLEGVEFIVCNTDAQSLAGSRAPKKIQLGTGVTGGLGAGAKPEVGRAAAEESLDDVMAHIEGANMVFITSGMGGGTGTGAAPVIARACKEAGVLTVGVVTKPFNFEGPVRMKAAEEGIREMQQYVDTLIVIPNQNLFRIATEKTTFADSFRMADGVLQSAVRGVTDLMIMPGLVNLDFNDIKTTMTEMGKAMMGTGESSGERRAVMAAEAAINNPLLDDVTMKGAKGVIINIAGGDDMTLYEIDEACNRIREEVDVNANIIFGTSIDESLAGSLRVTVLATGIETEADRKAREENRTKRVTADGRGVTARTIPAAARPYGAGVVPTEEPVYATTHAPAPELPTTAPYIQGQSFIPPAAIEADKESNAVKTVSYGRIIAGIPAPQMADIEMTTQIDGSCSVQEPVPGASIPAPVVSTAPSVSVATDLAIPAGMISSSHSTVSRRVSEPEPALSLFQRITNRVRRTVEVAFEDHSPESDYGLSSSGRAATQGAAVTAQALPVAVRAPVDVARPAGAPTAQTELDLDIPAFLRRQAS